MGFYRWQIAVVLSLAAAVCFGCSGRRALNNQEASLGGYAPRGREIMVSHKCGSCHTIPGIGHANGVVGPPLNGFGRTTYIAGNFPNTPQYLVRWLMSPKSMKPKTAMPDLGLSQEQAKDVAAYLYTLH
jgi:cytochrome c2